MPNPGAGRGVVMCVVSIILVTACGSSSPTPSPAVPSSDAHPSLSPSVAIPSAPSATAGALQSEPPTDAFLNAVVVTVSDRLVVRSQPRVSDDSTMYQPVLPLGTELTVLDGPVEASGYTWYKVKPTSFDGLGGPGYGWVARAGRDGEPWLALSPGTPPPVARSWSKPAKMSGLAGLYSFEQPLLVHGGDGYVLVDGSGAGIRIWFSTDARRWRVVAAPAHGSEDLTITDVAAGDMGFVAVGYEDIWGGADGSLSDTRAVVVFSNDGRHWQRILDPSFEHNSISRVGIVNHTIVAVGEGSWTSSDGLRWERQAGPGPQLDGFKDALVASDGRLTAFMPLWKDDRPLGTDVWQTDGTTWTKVARLPNSKDVRVTSAAYGAGHWLLLGSRDTATDSIQMAWTSEDGVRWDRARYPVPASDDGLDGMSLIGHAGGFVAVGWTGGPGGACGTDSPYTTATWTSSDGLVWHKWAPIKGTGVYAVVVDEGSIVGIGQNLALKKVRLKAPLRPSLPSGSRSPSDSPAIVAQLASSWAWAGCGP